MQYWSVGVVAFADVVTQEVNACGDMVGDGFSWLPYQLKRLNGLNPSKNRPCALSCPQLNKSVSSSTSMLDPLNQTNYLKLLKVILSPILSVPDESRACYCQRKGNHSQVMSVEFPNKCLAGELCSPDKPKESPKSSLLYLCDSAGTRKMWQSVSQRLLCDETFRRVYIRQVTLCSSFRL